MKKKIRLDGVEVEVDANIADALDLANASRAKAEKAQGEAEGKAKDLQARLDAAMDPKALDARVADRVELVSAAQKVLGVDFDAAGKSTRAVHEEVLKKVRADAKFEGRSDEYVAGAFAAACSSAEAARPTTAVEQGILASKTAGTREDANEPDVDAEYKASLARKRGEKPVTK